MTKTKAFPQIFTEKCLDVVGIVLLGTSGTDNLLAVGDDFQNVTGRMELIYHQ